MREAEEAEKGAKGQFWGKGEPCPTKRSDG